MAITFRAAIIFQPTELYDFYYLKGKIRFSDLIYFAVLGKGTWSLLYFHILFCTICIDEDIFF